MSFNELSAKPRRKKIDVPVHKCLEHDDNPKKTFSANFHSKKHKLLSADHELALDNPQPDKPPKVRKKQLLKENLKLTNENKELLIKFNELENLSVKKITKLKETIVAIQAENNEIREEYDDIQQRYSNLLVKYEELDNSYRLCTKVCEELKVDIEQAKKENAKFKTNNKQFSEDISMLKVVIFRLNVQLERYQETIRRHRINIPITLLEENEYHDGIVTNFENYENDPKQIVSEVHKSHKHTPISWGHVNSHTLGPLLDAYEDNIKEKDEIIKSYEKELCNFTGKLREIMDENEDLYFKLKEDEGCSSKLVLELETAKAELLATKQDNDALIKKCAIKQDKLEEVLKVYEAKVSQLKRDFDVLHGEYIRCRTENAGLKERNNAFVEAQEDFKNQVQKYIPISVHTSSVNECKRWYEELKSQYEKEKEKIVKNLEHHIKHIDELKQGIMELNATKEKLENKIAAQERNIKKMESKQLDLEHALNEVQLSRSALRKQLHKAMNFAKDMVAEQETLLKALNQRHIENKVVKKIGSEMAQKMDSLKSQLKDVQKNAWQEFNTVEKAIQEQANLIESMKQAHEHEIGKLTRIIKSHEDTNLLLKEDKIPTPQFTLFKEKYK